MRPRLGFLGAGWIGTKRLEAIAESGAAEVVAVADASPLAATAAASATSARAVAVDTLYDGSLRLDGLVIATPSALHANEAVRALEAGLAVFCQKPLGVTAAECRRVIEAARRADRLLAVDLSYREVVAVRRIRCALMSGEIGEVFAADLVFHNAYGPDKSWYRDSHLAGGGCVIDLGTHLIDLALWMLGNPRVEHVQSRLFREGEPRRGGEGVEDYALITFDAGRVSVSVSCSWFLHAGCDAVIGAAFHGTRGGVELRNVKGSFYDFVALQHSGTSSRSLAEPPDEWGGRAAVRWVERLAQNNRFDTAVSHVIDVATVIDTVYDR